MGEQKHTGHSFYHFFSSKKILLSIIVLLVFVIGVMCGIIFIYSSQSQTVTKQTITVTGNGIVDAPADTATIRATLSTANTNITLATADNKKQVTQIHDQLISLGLSEDAIEITTAVYPYTFYGKSSNPDIITTSFTIIFNKITMPLINTVKTTLLNIPNLTLGGSVTYSLTDLAPYQNQAEQQAIEDAKRQIDTLAKINNMTIGPIVSIESTPLNKNPQLMLRNRVFGKTTEVTAQYDVTYEIE